MRAAALRHGLGCALGVALGGMLAATPAPAMGAAPAQLLGTSGCVDYLARDGCAAGRGLGGADAVVVTPDGRSVYAGARAVVAFTRSSAGELTQLGGTAGCLSLDTRDRQVGRAGSCARVRGVLHADSLVVSSDGHAVYAADLRRQAIAVLDRDGASGALHQLAGRSGCLNPTGADGCTHEPRLGGLQAISLSASGRSAYVLAGDGRVVALSRGVTGALTPLHGRGSCLAFHARLGCARASRLQGAFKVLPSLDGRAVYVVTDYGSLVEDLSVGAVITLSRSAAGRISLRRGSANCLADIGRGCRRLPPGHYVDLAQDPAGHTLWLSGGPTYKGTFTSTSTRAITVGSGGSLTLGSHTSAATNLIFSADGHRAFGVSLDDGTVLVFARNPADSSLTLLSPSCIDEPSPGLSSHCVSAHGMMSPVDLAVSPDSQNLYVASLGSDGLSAFSLGAP